MHHTGTDPEERKQLEIEQEAWRTIDAYAAKKTEELLTALHEKTTALEQSKKDIEESKKEVEERKKELEEKDKIIEALKRKLSEK